MLRISRGVITLTAVLAASAVVAACGDDDSGPSTGPTKAPAGFITRADYAADWPFTIDSGQLACKGSGGVGSVTFKANGVVYAVNGTARSQNLGTDVIGITAKDASGVAKGNLNRVIADGLKLCK